MEAINHVAENRTSYLEFSPLCNFTFYFISTAHLEPWTEEIRIILAMPLYEKPDPQTADFVLHCFSL
jgi:hypothetical protein